MNTQSSTTGSAKCPVCMVPKNEWDTPDGIDGTYCCEACAKQAEDHAGSTAQARQNPSTSSSTQEEIPGEDRGNRPTQQRNLGSNVANVDADRQRKSSGQPDSDAASRPRTGRD